MKKTEEVTISFAGAEKVVPVTVNKEQEKGIWEALKNHTDEVVEDTNELVPPAENAVTEELAEELDPYATAIEAFFGGYQTFQEGMKALQKFTQPKLIFGKLMVVLEAFQADIKAFKEAEYIVPPEFQAGHDLVLEGIAKYDQFLVEYPVVLQGKGGLKAMKKVTQLGKLSADADQDMKKAFRAFDEATQGA